MMIAHPVLAAVLLLALVGVATATVPAFQATETPEFCRNCHEMGPYYDAWTAGAHADVSCVECHVDPGAVNHVSHKVVATKELWVHITGDPKFPRGTAGVPNRRCLTCHPGILDKTGTSFSHKQHAGAGPCTECHPEVGHKVTREALAKAGILKLGSETSGTATLVPVVARAGATLTPTHKPVSCAKCHDLAKVACSACHKPAHPDRGECTTCHQPGPRWSFSHPLSEDCASCHAAPAKHFGSVCTPCHSPEIPFAKTVFEHVSTDCASCHAAPASHRAGRCADCHRKPGVSWAFSHPSSSACASCHKAPSGHNRAASCATCHKKPGVSWAASHPASRACASCHKAPGNHFGTACASCHRPLVAWRSATFRHPSTGGEHTYRSFACAKCHPSGYSTHTCTACHGANGSDD